MSAEKKIIPIGTRIGNLTIIGIGIPYSRGKNKGTHSTSICKCDCGVVKTIQNRHLKSGTKSCGCLRKNQLLKHGEVINGSIDRLYHIWSGMRDRCNNINNVGFKNYGGRGISVCEEWRDYKNFKNWAITHGYEESLSIDRINVNGNYCPENCRWATRIEQNNNKRNNIKITINNEVKTLSQWSKVLKIDRHTLKNRYTNLKGN